MLFLNASLASTSSFYCFSPCTLVFPDSPTRSASPHCRHAEATYLHPVAMLCSSRTRSLDSFRSPSSCVNYVRIVTIRSGGTHQGPWVAFHASSPRAASSITSQSRPWCLAVAFRHVLHKVVVTTPRPTSIQPGANLHNSPGNDPTRFTTLATARGEPTVVKACCTRHGAVVRRTNVHGQAYTWDQGHVYSQCQSFGPDSTRHVCTAWRMSCTFPTSSAQGRLGNSRTRPRFHVARPRKAANGTYKSRSTSSSGRRCFAKEKQPIHVPAATRAASNSV